MVSNPGRSESGQVIPLGHGDSVTSCAFREWFGSSKVVDGSGAPLLLYHGTNADFHTFDHEQSREGDSLLFATPNRRVASNFALFRTTWGGANVMPVYAKAQRVLEVQGHGRNIRDVERDAQIAGMAYGETVRDYARRQGIDAILFKDVRDPVSPDIEPVDDVWAFFPTAQLKSALGNNGDFDPQNPSILRSEVEDGAQDLRLQGLPPAWPAEATDEARGPAP